MTKISYGTGFVKIGDKELICHNYPISPVMLEALFNDSVGAGTSFLNAYIYLVASPFYNRYSPLRYRRDANTCIIGVAPIMNTQVTDYTSYFATGATLSNDIALGQRTYTLPQIATTVMPMAIGNISVAWRGPSYLSAGYFPDDQQNSMAITSLDVPGTQIGQIFKHPTGRVALFNEVGIVALGQGELELEGTYDPDENKAYTMSYQIYFTKSGGTGVIDAGVGSQTNGHTKYSSNNDYFHDDGLNGFFTIGVHDQGNHFIAIRSGSAIDTYKILTVVDTNTVEVDAPEINNPFDSEETGLSWTLRTGPIAEYFIRYKRWTHYTDIHSNYLYAPYNSECLRHMQQEVPAAHQAVSLLSYPTMRTIHDRGACFWWVSPGFPQAQGEIGLGRWKMCCAEGYDFPVAYNSFSGLTLPTGIYNWRDIAIDTGNKLWICWANADDAYRLMKVDPYPAGNSKNPEILLKFQKQSSDADATGLCSSNPRGIVCPDDGSVWVFHADDGAGGNGGISYTKDGGTTWKRLHRLSDSDLTGTATVANGSTGVSGTTAAFDTELAVGDWIRFGSDTRSYEIATITDANTMTLATNYLGTGGTYTFKRGALTDTQARLWYGSDNGYTNTNAYVRPPCDFDTDGNVYWISDERDAVCRWKESEGAVTTVTATQMSVGYTFTSPNSLCVSRYYDVAGSGTNTPLQNNIWVGAGSASGLARIYGWEDFRTGIDGVTNGTTTFTSSTATFTADDVGKWIDVVTKGTYYIAGYTSSTEVTLSATVSAGSSLTWEIRPITKYHSTFTDSNFPAYVDMTLTTWTHWNASATQDRVSGAIFIYGHMADGGDPNLLAVVKQYPTGFGGVWEWRGYHQPYISGTLGTHGSMFDDIGLGTMMVPGFVDSINDEHATNLGGRAGFLHSPLKMCLRWDGSQWLRGRINSYGADLTFAATPEIEAPVSVGAGSRRIHEQPELLDAGIYAKFTQAGGATAQADEYIVDETTTFLGIIGSAKDNTQTADLVSAVHSFPTVYRTDEPIQDAMAPWTAIDGGIDGGYINSGTVGDMPVFMRGFAEGSRWHLGQGSGSVVYPKTDNWACNNPASPQIMACLRIKDEYDSDATTDGSITGATDVFTKGAGLGRDWVSGDLYKTIIIEGSVSSSGRYIITEIINTTDVRVHTTFAGTASVRWKLRDVPAVGYVALQYYYIVNRAITHSDAHALYSSVDYGQNWDLVKQFVGWVGVSPNDPITTYKDDGIMFDIGSQGWNMGAANYQTYSSASVIFDLRNLSQVERRKQYWKIYRSVIASDSAAGYPSSILILDENFKRLGIPDDCKVADFDDSLLHGVSFTGYYRLVPYDSTGNAVGVDVGNPYDFTDIVVASSDSFYEDSGSDGVTSGNDFSSVSAAFTIDDVGKKLRIPGDGGFCTITAIVSTTQVTTDYAFTGGTGLAWALLNIGSDDYLVFKEYTTSFKYLGSPLIEHQFKIIDVPTDTTIQVENSDVPLSVNFPFYIGRVPASVLSTWSTDAWEVAASGLGINNKVGLYVSNEQTEFIEIESGTTATAKADTDLDGMTDEVTVNADLDTAAVAGDVLALVNSATMYYRYYEIRSINRLGGGSTDIRVYFDEIIPASTYQWKVLRRRGMKVHVNKIDVITKEQIT